MEIDKKISVAFTGYRPEKIKLSSSNPQIEHEIRSALSAVLKSLYAEGYRMFLSGMAEGFDIWAAEEVLELKRHLGYEDVELVSVVPFREQAFRFSADYKLKYENILDAGADVIILSEYYYRGCYEVRNDYLLDNASLVICYFDGQPGGTKYTVNKAKKKGMRTINLYQSLTLF